jgi:glycosyltransferase involved in cell wall biosynthesis
MNGASTSEAGQTAVTIMVCCYNAARTVREALDSLLSQSHRALTVLVIDDGSTDESVMVVEEVAARDPRVRLVRNEANRGTAHTRMRALQAACDELVMFFDADDRAEPELVARFVARMEEDARLLGVSSYARYFGDSGTFGLQRIGPTSADAFFDLYRRNKLVFLLPVALFRRSAALQVGGYRTNLLQNDEGIRYEDYSEDLDLWCRMADLGAKGMYFVTIAEPLFWYRKPPNSLSTKNVFRMQLKMRWIKDCLVRRRAGQPERSLGEFMLSRSRREQLQDWRSDHAAMYYKKAGFAFGQKHFGRLAVYLALAGALSPKLILQKARTQRAAIGS